MDGIHTRTRRRTLPDLATLADYFSIMSDRPDKFTPEQVGYSPRPKFKEVCDDCIHYFRGKVAKRNTCEIMRPTSDTESVAPMGWCWYWNADYKTFPLLDKPECPIEKET